MIFMNNIFLKRYNDWGHVVNPSKVKVRQAIRINTLKISETKLVKILKAKGITLEKIPYIENAYFYESKFSLASSPEYLFGYFYIQDAASQLPVKVLNPKPGELVLDMCAAPGGKTTQMSSLMKNEGTIIALDIRNDRLSSLRNNLERLGCKNIMVYNKDAEYAEDLGLKFDKILLDAPCSGNFCIDDGWFSKRNLSDFNEKAFIQKRLLKTGVRCLKDGGILVYSTCSLEKEENEEVIDWALNELGVELIDLNLGIGEPGLIDTCCITRRLWPNSTNTQGFFVAAMIKK